MRALRRSAFSAKELFEDKLSIMSLILSVLAAGAALTNIALFSNRDKIFVRPIADVVQINNGDAFSFDLKPISEITSEDKLAKTVAWTGWTIRLSDLCQATGGAFSAGFSDAFQNGSAKLVVPADKGPNWTVVNADVTTETCVQLKNNSRSQEIYAIFDSKVFPIADRQMRVVLVPKTEVKEEIDFHQKD